MTIKSYSFNRVPGIAGTLAFILIIAAHDLQAQVLSFEPLQLYVADYPEEINGYETSGLIAEYSPALRLHSNISPHWTWFAQVGLSGINKSFYKKDFTQYDGPDPIRIYYSRLDVTTYAGAEFWTGQPGENWLIYRHSASLGLHLPVTRSHQSFLKEGHPGINTRGTLSFALNSSTMLSVFANYGRKFSIQDPIPRGGMGISVEYVLN